MFLSVFPFGKLRIIKPAALRQAQGDRFYNLLLRFPGAGHLLGLDDLRGFHVFEDGLAILDGAVFVSKAFADTSVKSPI